MAVTNNVDSNVQNQIIEEQIRQQQIQQQNAVNPAENKENSQVTGIENQSAPVTDAGANAKIGELNAQADLTKANLNQQADQIAPKTTPPASPPEFSPANPYLKKGISDETKQSLIARNPANQSLFDTEGGKKTVVWGGMVAVGDVARTALINRGFTVSQAVKTALFGDKPMPSNMSYHIAEGPIQSFSSQHPYADNNLYYGNEVYVTVKQLAKTIPGNENIASDAALTTIKDRLKENILDWDVTKDDLQAIQNTLNGLDKEDVNKVISKLSPAELKKWADETNGLLGGYNEYEKSELLGGLGSKLDATNLTKINDSYSREEDKIALANGVANNPSDDTKVNYAGELTKKIGTDNDSTVALTSMLGRMYGQPLETAIKNMSDTQLSKLSDVAIQRRINTNPFTGEATSTELDTKIFSRFLEATSRIQDASEKARVFGAGVRQIKTINDENNLLAPLADKKGAIASITNPLTNIITSNTTGMLDRLIRGNEKESLKGYLASMLSSGNPDDQQKIGGQIGSLLAGNSGKEDINKRFESNVGEDGKENAHANARLLGSYAGLLKAATTDIGADAGRRKDALKNLTAGILGVSGAAFPPLAIPAGAIGGIAPEAIDQFAEDVSKEQGEIADLLIKKTLPRDSNGLDPQTEGFGAYQGGYGSNK